MQNFKDIEKEFKDKKLFEQALTHKSWANENPSERESNERLEFLGDAVLELVVTDHLYKNLPDKDEGYLTALRANIVNTTNLAKLARKINLPENILLSKGEVLTGGRDNKSLLADTLEAIIGAMHIDRGIEAASKFILENLLSDLPSKIKEPLKDAKSRLQESLQAKKLPAPKYRIVKTTGLPHDREFTVQVLAKLKNEWEKIGEGIGKSKSEAEQKAASVALENYLKTE